MLGAGGAGAFEPVRPSDTAASGPIEDTRLWKAVGDPALQKPAKLRHGLGPVNIFRASELRELSGARGLVHVQRRSRIPAEERRVRARREPMGDQLRREIEAGDAGERVLRLRQEPVVMLAPV